MDSPVLTTWLVIDQNSVLPTLAVRFSARANMPIMGIIIAIKECVERTISIYLRFGINQFCI
jgi:hypothetical protein